MYDKVLVHFRRYLSTVKVGDVFIDVQRGDCLKYSRSCRGVHLKADENTLINLVLDDPTLNKSLIEYLEFK